MEIVEAIIGLATLALESAEACGCVLYILAGVLDGASAVFGVRAAREARQRRSLRAAGVVPPGRNRPWVAFLILLPFALLATALAGYTLVRWLTR